MFKKRVGVFYTPIKHDPRVYWTTSKTFLEKRVSMELITMTLYFVNVGIILELAYEKNNFMQFQTINMQLGFSDLVVRKWN